MQSFRRKQQWLKTLWTAATKQTPVINNNSNNNNNSTATKTIDDGKKYEFDYENRYNDGGICVHVKVHWSNLNFNRCSALKGECGQTGFQLQIVMLRHHIAGQSLKCNVLRHCAIYSISSPVSGANTMSPNRWSTK